MPQLFTESWPRRGTARLLENGRSRLVDRFEAERALRGNSSDGRTSYLVGLDLGTVEDFTALSVVEVTDRHRPGHAEYLVSHLERWRQVSYPRIAEEVLAIMQRPPLVGAELLCDATGLGLPVVQLLQRMGLRPTGITITGGDMIGHNQAGLTVPKQSLIGALQIVMQAHRIKVVPQLPAAQLLANELAAFQRRQNAITGHNQFAVWRENEHDDLTLSLCMPVWRAESTSVVRFY